MIDLLSCDALREWTFGYTAERRRDIDAAAARTRAVRQNRGLATCLSILMVFLGTLHSAMADLASPAYITTFGPPWPTFDIETLVYRNRTWQIPKQPTTERWFLWSQVPGCMDSSYVYTCPQERQLALTFDDGPW